MHMAAVVMRKLWVVLFIVTATVGSEAAGRINGEVKNVTTSYTTEVDINNKKKQPNWMSRGGEEEEGEAAVEVVMGVEVEEDIHGVGVVVAAAEEEEEEEVEVEKEEVVGGDGAEEEEGQGGGKGKGRGGRGGRNSNHVYSGRKRRFDEEEYVMGEFAKCMRKGQCKGMRLDCPLHCGGPCFYDCQPMCKAHCRRRRTGSSLANRVKIDFQQIETRLGRISEFKAGLLNATRPNKPNGSA
ncbi:hypothetical protein ACFX1W_016184 [Malus domestica]